MEFYSHSKASATEGGVWVESELIDNWQLTIDDWRLTIDDWRLTIDDWRLTIDDWRLTIDDWRLTIDDWRLKWGVTKYDFYTRPHNSHLAAVLLDTDYWIHITENSTLDTRYWLLTSTLIQPNLIIILIKKFILMQTEFRVRRNPDPSLIFQPPFHLEIRESLFEESIDVSMHL